MGATSSNSSIEKSPREVITRTVVAEADCTESKKLTANTRHNLTGAMLARLLRFMWRPFLTIECSGFTRVVRGFDKKLSHRSTISRTRCRFKEVDYSLNDLLVVYFF